MSQFFGKYRGKVEVNVDPLSLGRVQVSCPVVLGDGNMSWAMPASPSNNFFMIPKTGANIWVEFEGGNADYPIYSGCFWGKGEAPASPAVPEMTVIKTEGVTLTMSDVSGSGGLTIEVGSPAVSVPMTLKMDANGIEISMGSSKIMLTSASVSVNDGALEVV